MAPAADHPSDHDLITSVLRPMADAGHHHGFVGGRGARGFIHLADVYSVAHERLAERYAPAPGTTGGGGIWYFACPARCRHRAAAAGALGQGCWAASSCSETGGVAAARPVWGPDGRRVGQSRALSYSSCYGARTAAAVTRHGWCMVELALDDEQQGGGRGAGDFVLCKLFRSHRNEASSTAATAAPALVTSCKRKAAVDDHPDAPPGVRQQHLMQRSPFILIASPHSSISWDMTIGVVEIRKAIRK